MKRPGTDLKIREWKHDFQSYDYTNVFDLYVPAELNLGKNQIKIGLVGNRLEKESAISIDLIDALGQPIYHEISNIANEDQTRSIIAHVYGDTPIGSAKLYISANLATPFQGKKYLYTTDILVDSSKEVASDFVFKETPSVKYRERTFYSTTTNGQQSRKVEVSGSGTATVSVVSRTTPKQLQTGNLTTEKPSKTRTKSTTPNVQSDTVRAQTLEVPTFLENTVLTAENFNFSASMEGGTIYLNNVNFPLPSGNPISSKNIQELSYSASIVKVISTSSIEIYPPIRVNTTYIDANSDVQAYNADRLFNHANFTCSFFDYLPTTAIAVTKSFAVFEIGNLQTEHGKLDSVKISYKPVNEVGDYRLVGSFNTTSSPNLLLDTINPQSVEFSKDGLAEKSIGKFKTIADFTNYWAAFNGYVSSSLSSRIPNGIKVWDGAETGEYAGFRMDSTYANNIAFLNTDLKLAFDWELEQPSQAQMDVYVSGPTIVPAPENSQWKPVHYEPSSSKLLGNQVAYLGSITQENKSKRAEFYFKTLTESGVAVLFSFKHGNWHLGNIELTPNQDLGQNPTQIRIVAPLDNLFVTGSELSVKLDYLGVGGARSDYSTNLYGVKFDGTYIAQPSAATSSASTSAFTGEIRMISVATTPSGWLTCDGSAVSRTTYAALFSAIGTTYGIGDGINTFNVPDMRDRFMVGAGSTYSVGDTGGASSVTLATENLPSHAHTVNLKLGDGTSDEGADMLLSGAPASGIYATTNSFTGTTLATTMTGATGSASSVSIVPKYVGVRYIICHVGVSP